MFLSLFHALATLAAPITFPVLLWVFADYYLKCTFRVESGINHLHVSMNSINQHLFSFSVISAYLYFNSKSTCNERYWLMTERSHPLSASLKSDIRAPGSSVGASGPETSHIADRNKLFPL